VSTPAGWYSDPTGDPGAMRWWDGEAWTAHVAVTALPPPPETAAATLSRESGVARAARIAALATAVAMPIQLIVSAVLLSQMADVFRKIFSKAHHDVTPSFRVNPFLSLASNVTSLVTFAALIVTLVWVHAAATTAARIRIPARRSPGWAVGGFLIPVVNLWWPYQSVCDLFPAGHPARRVVARWWALYLCATFTPVIALAVAFASVPAALALGTVAAALYVGAALTLRQVIAMSLTTHAELVEGIGTR